MPSSYLTYAVDFDGDGRHDIWTSPQYGAPTEIILAIRGIETGFGTYTCDILVFQPLATLGWEPRRAGLSEQARAGVTSAPGYGMFAAAWRMSRAAVR